MKHPIRPEHRPHEHPVRSRRRRALLKRTPWICFERPLIDLPPTWGLTPRLVRREEAARCPAN